MTVRHLTRSELEAGLDGIRSSPRDNGIVELIVARPASGLREMPDQAHLDPDHGMSGDSWAMRVTAPESRDAADRHECPCHRAHRAGPRPLAARR